MPAATELTPALIRQRLASNRLRADPTDVVMPPGSDNWPAETREALAKGLKPAGVLVPVVPRDTGLTLLLTRRSAELKHHASQISFPGGRMEDGDADISATALRETHEEVGIEPAAVSVLGYLDPMPTVTGYAVTPTVGLVEKGTHLTLDRNEVELAFEVPLAFLLEPGNAHASEREYNGRIIPVIEFRFEEHRIWGATAYMVLQLRENLIKQ